jgi:predicted membrane-bound mannosyltransferase
MSVTTLSPESTGSSKPSSLLERPAFGLLRINWETLAWILLFVVGGLARFIMLDARAMSHDESLHTLYSYYLYANGNYDHNPMMHGPFRYHFTALIYFLLGRPSLGWA